VRSADLTCMLLSAQLLMKNFGRRSCLPYVYTTYSYSNVGVRKQKADIVARRVKARGPPALRW